MSTPKPSHLHITTTAGSSTHLAAGPEPDISVRCHRRLRGPYSGGGALLREHVVPELLERAPDLIYPRRIEIIALAPELASRVPSPPWTLTEHAEGLERTRYYGAGRTRRLAHGIAELLTDWARECHSGGVIVEFRELDQADPTDRELIGILLRRCDPALLTLLIEGNPPDNDVDIAPALTAYTRAIAARAVSHPEPLCGADLAQLYIDSDGTDSNPAVFEAYLALPVTERARRHTARIAELETRDEPTLYLGAVPFHAERCLDVADTGVRLVYNALVRCLNLGFYHAALELGQRGRAMVQPSHPKYTHFTHKVGACLTYLGRGWEAMPYFTEQQRMDIDLEVQMGAAYMLSMLYTRHLPLSDHNEDTALEWANIAIAFADNHPDLVRRTFVSAFMRNARALVELHRKNMQGALDLVQEAAALMDANSGPDGHRLHRSVLKYNRGQVLAGLGDLEAALAVFDDVIEIDTEYADYYFERAGLRRATGQYDGAFEDYDRAIALSPPFFEVYVNRADLLRELGDDERALADLNYALELEPDQMNALINRAEILLAAGETRRAAADIEHGLALEPANPHLLVAQAALLTETGDEEGAWASYSAALRADPSFVVAWANRAVLAYSLGRPAQAVDDLDHAIKLENSPTLRANRAIALQDLGEHARALADLDAVLAEGSADDPDVLYRRGVSRHAVGDITGARSDWRAHLATYSTDSPSPHLEEIRRLDAGINLSSPASKLVV